MSLFGSEPLPSSWQSVQLAELIMVHYGKALAAGSRATSGRVPVIGSSGVVGRHDRALVDEPCIVVGRKGAAGAVHMVNESCWPIDTAYFIQPPSCIELKYLYWLLGSMQLGQLDKSTAIPSLSRDDLYRAMVPIASQDEQIRIVEKLEELLSELDAGVAELKAAQRKLARYRQSLLKAAVEGALTADWRASRAENHESSRSSSPRRRGSKDVRPGTEKSMDSRLRGDDGQDETGAELLQRILAERRARWETIQLVKFVDQGKTSPKDWKSRYRAPTEPDTADLPSLPQGWAWASIEQISADDRYSLAIGPFGSNLTVPDYRESGVPLVFVRNIRSGKYGGSYTKYITQKKANELKAHRVDPGDVLVTKMGEPPGDADVYPVNQPPAVITADCIKIRCRQGMLLPDFLAAAINSRVGKQQIGPITQGVAQKKVSLGRFSTIAVPLPPFEEQLRIAELLTCADREMEEHLATLEHALKQAAAQRKNILKAAFAGQLVAQDPSDEPASVLLERIRAARAARSASGGKRVRKTKAPA